MKQLALITCFLLILAAPGLASESYSHSHIAPDTADSPFALTPAPESPHDTRVTTLGANDLEAVAGTGAGTDFGCGAAAGAGLAIAMSGIGAPFGIALAFAGFGCAFFF